MTRSHASIMIAGVLAAGIVVPQAHATTNLALGGSAYGSSQVYGPASAAIDGNTDTTYAGGSIFETGFDQVPFFVVDLGSNYALSSLNIYQRTDELPRLLHDFTVSVFDAIGNVTFTHNYATSPGDTVGTPFAIAFGAPVLGKAVQVVLNNPDYLALAEVQVFGNSVNQAADVPEPASLALLAVGIAAAAANRRAARRRT